MKKTLRKTILGVCLTIFALGNIGCSSSPSVWYWGDKAYARDPYTGEIRSWEYKESEGRGYEEYGEGSELGYLVAGILNCVVN